MIIGIVAVDKNWAIGRTNKETGKGELLFKLPKDLQFFKEQTQTSIVVMGYTTYLSLPKRPLPNRVNLVLWDQATSLDCLDGCITFNDFKQLLRFVQILAKIYKVYICGGASIYKLFLPYYDSILVDKVDAIAEDATAFFPNLDEDKNFKATKYWPSELDGDHDQYVIRICQYERVK